MKNIYFIYYEVHIWYTLKERKEGEKKESTKETNKWRKGKIYLCMSLKTFSWQTRGPDTFILSTLWTSLDRSLHWRWMKKIRDSLMMTRAILQSSFGLNHLIERFHFSLNQLLIEKLHSVNKLLILFYTCSVSYRPYSAYTISKSLHFKIKPTSDNNIFYILLNKKLCEA
jgi:hypothetical protein